MIGHDWKTGMPKLCRSCAFQGRINRSGAEGLIGCRNLITGKSPAEWQRITDTGDCKHYLKKKEQ